MSALTFRPGDRVRSTSASSAGRVGVVREARAYLARLDGAGVVIVPARQVVTVDLDGESAGVAFVADGGAPLALELLDGAPMPEPNCPAWCDRSHGGFDGETSPGDIAVMHSAVRGGVIVGAVEYLDPDGSRTLTTLSLDLPNSSGDFEAETPAGIAVQVRALNLNLAALADALDGGPR
ncbi:hypothetical protein ET495_06150 [Xylanimonas allomyrinae]|uniref:Uncharacterized protein n=1 Tax=Xylanimonas allomyrinae TaxID=2509459 RepID=A0A4P6EKG9_9MICO|nr:hypothetical protein [Xylanimonas allomyrinae]QAY62895.1 hypothetical protein ET495_06150 [Xylanimonas allomyrinae]